MNQLILMIQFFTRIPISIQVPASNSDFAKGVKWLPLVGLLIGGILAGIHTLCAPYFNALTLSALVVFLEVFLSGGLHLDGLADSFDGLYSNRGKERVLEIMKDSRIGSNGALALIALIIMKIAFLTNLSAADRTMVLVFMPSISRFGIALGSWLSVYARNKGMGQFFIGNVSKAQVLSALVVVALPLAFYPPGYIVLAGSALFVHLYVKHVRKIIDGMTGDTLGAMIELSELFQLPIWILVIQLVK